MVRNKPEQLLNDIEKITDRLTDDQSKSKLFAFPYVSISLAYINFLIFPISSFSQLDLKIKSYLQRTSEKIKRLLQNNYILQYNSNNLQIQSVVSFIIANQFKKERTCRFQLSDPLPIFGMWLVALQKDSKYRTAIHDA